MSYVLHVWESPQPATVVEAGQIQTRLSEETSAQNPKFVAFAAALVQATGRHAHRSLQDPWSDEPLDGRTQHPVYAIGVRTASLAAVLPLVMSTASRLGLTVFDMQAARAYLPDGKVLVLPGAQAEGAYAAQPADAEQLESVAQLTELVVQRLQPFLEGLGYKLRKSDQFFVRRLRGLTEDICIIAEDGYPEFRFKLFVTFLVKEGVEHLNAALGAKLREFLICSDTEKFRSLVPTVTPGYPDDGWFRVRTVSAAGRAADVQLAYLRDVILPCLRECDTLAGIDKYINALPLADGPLSGNIGPAVPALVAWLTGNPRCLELQRLLLESIPPNARDERLEKMISYLAARTQQASR